MRSIRILAVIAVAVVFSCSGIYSRKIHLRLPTPEKDRTDVQRGLYGVEYSSVDTVAGVAAIEITGYDKPTSTDVETMFIKNNTGERTAGIEVEIVYRDMDGNQLHERREYVDFDSEPGKRTMITLRTWDRQKSYHYYKSRRTPRRASIAYKVEIKVLNVYYSSREIGKEQ